MISQICRCWHVVYIHYINVFLVISYHFYSYTSQLTIFSCTLLGPENNYTFLIHKMSNKERLLSGKMFLTQVMTEDYFVPLHLMQII